QRLRVKRGVHVDGNVKDQSGEAVCRFRTCLDVDVRPMKVSRVYYQEREQGAESGNATVVAAFELLNTSLAQLDMANLRLYLGDGLPEAGDLLYLLRHQLRRIEIRDERGRRLGVLEPSALSHAGFAPEEGLLCDRPRHLPAFEILREYFLFPEKFLFLDLD